MALHFEISMKSMLGLAASSSCKQRTHDTDSLSSKSENDHVPSEKLKRMMAANL